MDWLELSVSVTRARAESLCSLLEDHGALAVTTADAGDTPVIEPGPGETPLWPEVRVTGLFPGEADEYLLRALLAPHLSADGALVSSRLGDKDWERAWMDDFKPMRFGHRLWVCPSNQAPPPEAAVPVILDPGLAFGTGTHPTTALCLGFLDRHVQAGDRILDFGCGSGILAVAALKLGAAQATCVDTDPQAIEATWDNARRNQVTDGIRVPEGSLELASIDLVVANILAGPLVDLAPTLAAAARPGARLALSGILVEQRAMVENAYRNHFRDFDVAQRDDWVCLSAVRRSE